MQHDKGNTQHKAFLTPKYLQFKCQKRGSSVQRYSRDTDVQVLEIQQRMNKDQEKYMGKGLNIVGMAHQ